MSSRRMESLEGDFTFQEVIIFRNQKHMWWDQVWSSKFYSAKVGSEYLNFFVGSKWRLGQTQNSRMTQVGCST